MISHEQALSQYEAYFGNRLNRDETRDFHAHLNDCEACRVRLRVMRASTPRTLIKKNAEINQDAKLRETFRNNRMVMAAALAVLLGFIVVMRLFRIS